jgi:hypothetical protein
VARAELFGEELPGRVYRWVYRYFLEAVAADGSTDLVYDWSGWPDVPWVTARFPGDPAALATARRMAWQHARRLRGQQPAVPDEPDEQRTVAVRVVGHPVTDHGPDERRAVEVYRTPVLPTPAP